MAGTRQILQRRYAAQNISKVTHTMETISSVRYRQYYKMWSEGIEFYDSLAQLVYLAFSAHENIPHPLAEANDSKTNAILVTGSDRGLCGSYNSNLFRLVDVHIKMAKRFHRELKIYAQGKKIAAYLAGRGVQVEHEYVDIDELPTIEQVKSMSEDFSNQFRDGKIGRFGIVYTRFYSPASQQAQTLTILPLADLVDDLTTRATVIWPWELAFEDFLLSPGIDEIFDGLATMMIQTAIAGCFLEASLSEHLGRVVSMRSATDNANDMIESLTRDYNRARQGQITGDMLDILGGALAVQ